MSKRDHHLRRRKNVFLVNIGVPVPLRRLYGKNTIEKSLQTTDPQEALILRDGWLADMRAEFLEAERRLGHDARAIGSARPLAAGEAFDRIRREPSTIMRAARAGAISPFDLIDVDPHKVTPDALGDYLQAQADGVVDALTLFEHGQQPAPALPPQTPLMDNLDKWSHGKPRTVEARRSVVLRFTTWASAKGLDSFEAITRRIAATYIDEGLTGLSARTARKHVTILSSFWTWSLNRGDYEGADPWARQPMAKVVASVKRPWTDDELAILLAGDPGQPLADLIQIAALTGMRIEEICQLRVADCANGSFRIVSGKTPSARRVIPIHSQLSAIVSGRCEGREPGEYLIGEIPEPKGFLERSHPMSIAFTVYRRSIGLSGEECDFHSLRRRFADKATVALERGNAGFTEWAFKEVMGHARKDVTSLYAGPRPEEAKRAVVESVKLPDQRA